MVRAETDLFVSGLAQDRTGGGAGAPHAHRTRPPRASSVHGWAGRASMLRLGRPGGADQGGAAVYDQELAGDVAGVAGGGGAGGLAGGPAGALAGGSRGAPPLVGGGAPRCSPA